MLRRGVPTAALLLLTVLAGCAGGSDADVASSDPEGPDAPSGSASIAGHVTNDEGLPVPGVTVAVREANRQTVTDDAGAFTIAELPGGVYTIIVQKLGYETGSQRVTVAEEGVATVAIVLEAITVDEVYHQSLGPYNGHVTCGFSRPGVPGILASSTGGCPASNSMQTAFGNNENLFEFELEQENLWAIVGEMRWTPTAYATSDSFSIILDYEGGGAFDWWCQGAGPSPVQFTYHIDEDKRKCDGEGGGDGAEDPPDMDHDLQMSAYVPFHFIRPTEPTSVAPHIAIGQSYESMVTIFYGEDPVEPFTAFDDA